MSYFVIGWIQAESELCVCVCDVAEGYYYSFIRESLQRSFNWIFIDIVVNKNALNLVKPKNALFLIETLNKYPT